MAAELPQRIWVLDTSALVEFKRIISVATQWAAFKTLEDMVMVGAIAMPRQVIAEAASIDHPDVPGAWAPGVRAALKHPLAAEDDFIARVMSEAGDVVDSESERDEADPWICALALQLQTAGYEVTVVTEDRVDRLPIKIALTTACNRLRLRFCTAREFLDGCGIPTLSASGDDDGDD